MCKLMPPLMSWRFFFASSLRKLNFNFNLQRKRFEQGFLSFILRV